jgi:hypothetical protein
MRILTGCLLTVALAACSSVSVQTDYDHSVDFSQYKTWGWAQYNPDATLSLNESILHKSITSALADKKLTYDQENADLLVMYTYSAQQETQVTSDGWGGWGWGGMDVYQYDQGNLLIGLIDPKMKQVVWRGTGQAVLPESGVANQSQVNEVVDNMFVAFPPPAPKASE